MAMGTDLDSSMDPRESYITSGSLTFLICKMGVIIKSVTWDCCENVIQNIKVIY